MIGATDTCRSRIVSDFLTTKESMDVSHFSAIDLQTRLEVQDLLSRFCHALDHNKVEIWVKLFALEGYINAPRLGCFTGRDEIMKIPEMVREQGGGAWRHYLNNMYIDHVEGSRDLRVEAYCMVSDWRQAGHVVRCWDFSARVGKRKDLKIISLKLTPVTDCEAQNKPLDASVISVG